MVSGELPRYKQPQRSERHASFQAKVSEKLEDIRRKAYIMGGRVNSLTTFFWVPKGEQDIRLVYDTTKSGLNQALWAPTFGMPTVENLVKGVMDYSWMGDMDISEMFLNFNLHPDLHPYCGIDLSAYQEGEEGGLLWERWVRCMMGLKISPYVTIKGFQLAMEVVRGNRRSFRNPLKWTRVKKNLPGSPSYDPTKPFLWRTKSDNEEIAALIIGYVDDLRAADSSEEGCWRVMQRTGSLLSYLGIQVAARKTRPPTRQPGAWAGSIVVTDAEGVGVKLPKDKWDKVKGQISQLQEMLRQDEWLDRKELEIIRGSLVYVQRTYPSITPYLKGLHLTIDSWRPHRDEEGWVIPPGAQREESVIQVWTGEEFERPFDLRGPMRVKAVPRLRQDLESLAILFQDEAPPIRYVRAKHTCSALYGYGDASGGGFGSAFSDGNLVRYRHGLWGRDQEDSSSNFKELLNLTCALEEGLEEGFLRNAEVWIFTDNFTTESVFYKGKSTNPRLFDLALRLWKLEMGGNMKILMIHIPGTRMIEQGTDGLLRGELFEGSMRAVGLQPMRRYINQLWREVASW
jgi:hypothetical protein